MDAGSFVIALITAAGAAAGPAALGALPDTTVPTARCIAAPDDQRSGSARSDAEELAQRRTDDDVDLDTTRDTGQNSRQDNRQDNRQDTSTGSSALAEELAQELAEIVADSDDPTSRRLAAALAAAGFEASATGSRQQQTTASRSDDTGLDDSRLDDSRLDDSRLDENDSRNQRDNNLDQDQRSNNRSDDSRLGRDDDQLDCNGRARQQDTRDGGDAGIADEGSNASGANRSRDLEDVLSSRDSDGAARERVGSSRSNAPVERGGSGIDAALERGERTAE